MVEIKILDEEINMWSIYKINPAPWGDDYRLVESFDTEEDAQEVLDCLESVNILFNTYKIICWEKSNETI